MENSDTQSPNETIEGSRTTRNRPYPVLNPAQVLNKEFYNKETQHLLRGGSR